MIPCRILGHEPTRTLVFKDCEPYDALYCKRCGTVDKSLPEFNPSILTPIIMGAGLLALVLLKKWFSQAHAV